jgi:UMF1 family MFS transporter
MSETTAPTRRPRLGSRKEIFGWAMFDFANSSYTTVVISAVYSSFFVAHVVPAEWATRDTWWSVAIMLSTLVALALSPLAGAVCDLSGRKKRWLFESALTCALATMGLGLVGPGQVGAAIALLVVSNAAFMLSETFCGALLVDIAHEEDMGWVSGVGWGIGYFGGLLSIVLVTQLIVRAEGSLEPALHVQQVQGAMLGIGLFFVIFSLPTFLLVKVRSRPRPGFENAGLGRLFVAGVRSLGQSAALARANPTLFRFLLAFMVYMAGLDAIIKFVGIYATQEVRLSQGQLGALFLILQLSAAAGALGFGALEQRLGPRTTVLLSLGVWMTGTIGIWALPILESLTGLSQQTIFFGLGVLAGSAIGATQSASRAIVGMLAPPDQAAQVFGYWSMFVRVSTLMAMTFGLLADRIDRRPALWLIVAFFAVGAWMLRRIDIDGAVRARRAALSGT